MATLVGIIVAALITTMLGFIGGAVESLYNLIMGDPLLNFSETLTFLPQLLYHGQTAEGAFSMFYNTFAVISIGLVIVVTIVSVVKAMFIPAVGKESDSPVQILFRACAAAIGIGLYKSIIDIYVNGFLVKLAATDMFTIALEPGTVGSAWTWTGLFNPADILEVIFYVSILVTLISASITHLERMLSFSLYILLGPICLAFYPSSESKGITSDWVKGILSQTFGIFLSLFAMTLVGHALIACKDDFSLFNLAVVVALLGFVKNSEKFVNMLGFKTMPNGDTMRSIAAGFGATVMGARAGYGVGKNGWEKGTKTLENWKNGETALQRFAGKNNFASNRAQANQKETLGATLNDVKGSVNSKDNFGNKLADINSANTPLHESVKAMDERKFNKLYNNSMTDGTLAQRMGNFLNKEKRTQRKNAYNQYKDRIDQSNSGRQKMKSSEDIDKTLSANEFSAAVGLGAYNKQLAPGTEITKGMVEGAKSGENHTFMAETLTENPNNPGEFTKNTEVAFVDSMTYDKSAEKASINESASIDVSTYANEGMDFKDKAGRGEGSDKGFIGEMSKQFTSFSNGGGMVSIKNNATRERVHSHDESKESKTISNPFEGK